LSEEETKHLQPYVLSKWKCPTHGYYSARTATLVDPSRPILCPECIPEFIEPLAGKTSMPVPFITKPRIPSKTDLNPTFSKNARLMKRGPVR
jgi:hypothetical protein